MGIVRKGIESLVPGGALIGAGAEAGAGIGKAILSHPYRSLAALGSIGLIGGAGFGMWQGKFETSLSLENEITAGSEGKGTITLIDVEFPDIPMAAATVEVGGIQTRHGRELGGTILGKKVSIPAGATWVDLQETVQSDILFDTKQITVEHDSGSGGDDYTDDRFIVSLPSEAISVNNYIEPDEERYEFHGDFLTGAENFASAWGQTFDKLKSVPGIGHLDDAKNAKEQMLLGATRLNTLDNVATDCMPKVVENESVYKAMHNNVANVAPLAIRDSDDPKIQELKDKLTVTQLEEIEVVVYIGAESDAQPFLPNQVIKFQNQYAEELEELKKDPDLNFTAVGDFECEMSDELKALLGDTTEPTEGPTESSTEVPSESVSARAEDE